MVRAVEVPRIWHGSGTNRQIECRPVSHNGAHDALTCENVVWR